MKPITNIDSPKLATLASAFAGLALVIAPFRASAGVRSGLLILAAIAILVAYRKARPPVHMLTDMRMRFGAFVPPSRALNVAIFAWLFAVGAWACVSANPIDSLRSWRGDVLTPLLAGGVFYALTKDLRALARWFVMLLAGLTLLTWFAVISFPQSTDPDYVPWYVDVGFLSTWLITLFPLAILAAQLAFQQSVGTRYKWLSVTLVIITFVLIAVTTSATHNRVAWVCFLLVVGIHLFVALLDRRAITPKLVAAYVLGLLLLAVLFSVSIESRASLATRGAQGGIEFLLADVRTAVWQRAWEMIQSRPLTGYGYAVTGFGDQFSAPLSKLPAYPLLQHAHNVVLNYTLQIGIAGALVIVALFVALLAAFAPLLKSPGMVRMVGVCGISLVLTFFARNMVDDFFMRHTLLFFAAACGMLLGVGYENRGRSVST